MKYKEIALVYMAAGVSSRFGGRVKQLVEVGSKGERLMGYSMKQASSAGFSKIVIIVGEKTEKLIKKYFGDNYMSVPIFYAFQRFDSNERDKPLGTVDALCSASEFIDCSFVVCNGDDLYGENSFRILADHLRNYNDNASIGYRLGDVLPEKGTTNRGIFRVDENRYVVQIKETFNIEKSNLEVSWVKKDDLCSMNLFALQPDVVEMLYTILTEFKEKYKGDRKKECLLSEELSQLIKNGKIKMKIYDANEKWLGVTNPGDEEFVKKEFLKFE